MVTDEIFRSGRAVFGRELNVKNVVLPYGRRIIIGGEEIAAFFPKFSDHKDIDAFSALQVMYAGEINANYLVPCSNIRKVTVSGQDMVINSLANVGYYEAKDDVEVVVLDLEEARAALGEFAEWCTEEVRRLVLEGEAPLFGIVEGAHRVRAVQEITHGTKEVVYSSSVPDRLKVVKNVPFKIACKVLRRGGGQDEVLHARVANVVGDTRVSQTVASDIQYVDRCLMLASTRALLFSSDAAEKHPRDLMVSDINGGGVKRVAEVLFRSGGAVVTGQVFLRFYFFAPRCVLDFITETAEAEGMYRWITKDVVQKPNFLRLDRSSMMATLFRMREVAMEAYREKIRKAEKRSGDSMSLYGACSNWTDAEYRDIGTIIGACSRYRSAVVGELTELEKSVLKKIETSAEYDKECHAELATLSAQRREMWRPSVLERLWKLRKQAADEALPSVSSDDVAAAVEAVVGGCAIKFVHSDYWEWFLVMHEELKDSVDCIFLDPPFDVLGERDRIPEDMVARIIRAGEALLVEGGTLAIFCTVRDVGRWHDALDASNTLVAESSSPMHLIYNSDGIRKAHRTVHTKMVSYVQPLVVAHKFTTRRSRANVNFRVGDGSHLNYHFHKNGAPINANILEDFQPPSNSERVFFEDANHFLVPLRVEQKREIVVRELLHRWTPRNGRVVDFFGGTGTTAEAMHRLGLEGWSVDSDPECYVAGRLRLAKTVAKLSGDYEEELTTIERFETERRQRCRDSIVMALQETVSKDITVLDVLPVNFCESEEVEDTTLLERAKADAVEHNLAIAPSRIEGAGLGLFVTSDVAPETTLIEYAGIWYTAHALSMLSSEERRRVEESDRLITPCWEVIGDDGTSSKLLLHGSKASAGTYANSAGAEMINTRYEERVGDDGSAAIYLVASKALNAQDEIYIDYGPSFWGHGEGGMKERVIATVRTMAQGNVRRRKIHRIQEVSLYDVAKMEDEVMVAEEPGGDDDVADIAVLRNREHNRGTRRSHAVVVEVSDVQQPHTSTTVSQHVINDASLDDDEDAIVIRRPKRRRIHEDEVDEESTVDAVVDAAEHGALHVDFASFVHASTMTNSENIVMPHVVSANSALQNVVMGSSETVLRRRIFGPTDFRNIPSEDLYDHVVRLDSIATHLWLGDKHVTQAVGWLDAVGVTDIISLNAASVKKTQKVHYIQRFKFHLVPMKDTNDGNSARKLETLFDERLGPLMQELLSSGKHLVLHCAEGRSRSVTVALLYAMRYARIVLCDAWVIIYASRIPMLKAIVGNDAFRNLLVSYERKVFGCNTLSVADMVRMERNDLCNFGKERRQESQIPILPNFLDGKAIWPSGWRYSGLCIEAPVRYLEFEAVELTPTELESYQASKT